MARYSRGGKFQLFMSQRADLGVIGVQSALLELGERRDGRAGRKSAPRYRSGSAWSSASMPTSCSRPARNISSAMGWRRASASARAAVAATSARRQ